MSKVYDICFCLVNLQKGSQITRRFAGPRNSLGTVSFQHTEAKQWMDGGTATVLSKATQETSCSKFNNKLVVISRPFVQHFSAPRECD
jgi:hypothetical protein